MPINLVAKAAGNAGVVSPTLGDAAVNFDGTFVTPGSFKGSISADLGQSDADFVGLFTQLPNRAGTIATTLSDGSADFTSAAPSSEPYDLSGFDIHFPYVWPTAPSTSRDVTVTSVAQLNAEIQTGGAIIRVNQSMAGNVSFNNASDVDIIMSNTATITGNVALSNSNRMRWTGGSISGQAEGTLFADILFNNVKIESTNGNAIELNPGQTRWERLAVINSTLRAVGGGGSGWGIHSRPVVNSTPAYNDGLILANVHTSSDNYQGARIQDVTNLIIVDSFAKGSGVSGTGWRIHHRSTNVYGGDVVGIGLFKMDSPGTQDPNAPQVINGRFNNWQQYRAAGGSLLWANHLPGNTGIVLNSGMHGDNANVDGTMQGISPMTDGGGNIEVSWDSNLASIDWSQIPGKSSQADYGADH